MESDTRKRRFSNFDVLPEQGLTTSISSSFLAQYQTSNLQVASNAGFSAALYMGEAVSIVDPVYALRLETALERNFEYIIR